MAKKYSLPQPKEHEIQRAILEYLQLRGIFAWRNNTGAKLSVYKGRRRLTRFGFRGCSDILGVLRDGRFLAIEVKRPGGKLTPYQEAFLGMVKKNAGLAIVAYSIEDVERVL